MKRSQYKQIARDARLATRRANKLPRLMRWAAGMKMLRTILAEIAPTASKLANANWAFDNLTTERRKETRAL